MTLKKINTNHLTARRTVVMNSSTYLLKIMEDPLSWDYFKEGELKRRRTRICITCNHFRFSTTDTYATILTCPIQRKLIPQGDHLFKGCNYWLPQNNIFAPEAA